MRFKSGFTLIEMVVGIVVLAVAMTIVTGVFLPQASKTLTPMYQIRATGLAKSIMNQALIRDFDEIGGFDVYCDNSSSDRKVNLAAFLPSGSQYDGYGLSICIADRDTVFGGIDSAKLVTVLISMPNNETIALSSFRGNY